MSNNIQAPELPIRTTCALLEYVKSKVLDQDLLYSLRDCSVLNDLMEHFVSLLSGTNELLLGPFYEQIDDKRVQQVHQMNLVRRPQRDRETGVTVGRLTEKRDHSPWDVP